MGTKTGISWTDATWNPIRGCSRVSEGCRNCYAESVAHRFSGPGLPYHGLVQVDAEGKSTGKWNGRIKFVEKHLLDPLKWKEPRRIFVNSMSDLFHENVTDEMRDKIFAVMALAKQHTFQILTKRPERMLAYISQQANEELGCDGRQLCLEDSIEKLLKQPIPYDFVKWPLPNVHLGVSVEDQKTADLRIPILLQTPAAKRFISAEPLLGVIDLNEIEGVDRLDWIITGGESGHGARPMHPDWAHLLRDWCVEFGVPFFFKQWGEWEPVPLATVAASPIACRMVQAGDVLMNSRGCVGQINPVDLSCSLPGLEMTGIPLRRVGVKAAGHLLDGVEHHEFPVVQR